MALAAKKDPFLKALYDAENDEDAAVTAWNQIRKQWKAGTIDIATNAINSAEAKFTAGKWKEGRKIILEETGMISPNQEYVVYLPEGVQEKVSKPGMAGSLEMKEDAIKCMLTKLGKDAEFGVSDDFMDEFRAYVNPDDIEEGEEKASAEIIFEVGETAHGTTVGVVSTNEAFAQRVAKVLLECASEQQTGSGRRKTKKTKKTKRRMTRRV